MRVCVYNTKGVDGLWGSSLRNHMMIPPQIFLVFLGFYRLSLPDITVQGHVREPIHAIRGMGCSNAYLFITYIVTSKPKRNSVAAGDVHIIVSLI